MDNKCRSSKLTFLLEVGIKTLDTSSDNRSCSLTSVPDAGSYPAQNTNMGGANGFIEW